jgi:hypothetical protein
VADSLIARAPAKEIARRREAPDGYERGRLIRAAAIPVYERYGPGQYRVKGTDEPEYFVDLSADIPCYCKDAQHHGRGCKHELCARLQEGDMGLRLALGQILLEMQKQNEALMRRVRKAS